MTQASSIKTDLPSPPVVTIPANDWEAFKAWINRPAETIPALAELAGITPSWEK
jgi:hypothetical protein